MPRIRTIKPEFFDSPGTAKASHAARLLFIAMWCWADDYGVGSANTKAVVGFAFPNDADITASELPTLYKEVSDCYGVVFYEVGERPYYSIPSWDTHQRTERKARRLNPPPPFDIGPGHSPGGGTSDDTQGTSVAPHGSSGVGTGEQGNRGTGEQKPSAAPKVLDPSGFDEFWRVYPRKVGKDGARRAWSKLVKRKIDTRIVIDRARRYAADPNLPDKQFIPHPSTWMNDGRWEDDEPCPPRRDHLSVVRGPKVYESTGHGMAQEA